MWKNTFKILLLITLLYIPKGVFAAGRTVEQKHAAAIKVLCMNNGPKFIKMKGKADRVKELYADSVITIMGLEDGGFALIANDDKFDAVIGYSDSKFSTAKAEENKNYQWWLKAISQVLGSNETDADKKPMLVEPSGDGIEKSVAPMLTTTWAQDAPYNNYCPTDGGKHTLVGCVATAMSQVLFYNSHPTKGDGQRTIYYPYNDTDGTAYTVDFSKAEYKYDLMLNSYSNGYTEEQADAVATLCYHCGVATDMQYGLSASGALMSACRDGLARYFDYSNATLYSRQDYSETDWMNLIFKELSNGLPIIYGGADLVNFGSGHCFVFDGYDASGNVHVNWGWAGSYDGYYNVAYLNPASYAFTDNQTMILGIDGRNDKDVKKSVKLSEAGSLSELVTDEEKYTITSLEVKGPVNSSDLKFIREMAGRNADDSRTRGRLKNLDLSKAEIKAGGEPFFGKLTTIDGEIPAKAFYDCYSLSYVKLPENTISIGEAAFANAIGLDSIYVPTDGNRNYVYAGGVVYSKDTTCVLTTMPFVCEKLTLLPNVKKISDNGMAGCAGLRVVDMPASVEYIGESALSGNSFVTEIKIRAKKVPTVKGFAFEGIAKNECRVYVPAGYKDKYDKAEGWRQFIGNTYDNIKMFGSYVAVRNVTRQYGEENPKLSYTVTGDEINGTPELSCEAEKTSPSGRYTISIQRGTIRNEDVELADGYLVVSRSPLKVIANDTERPAGTENPEFSFRCEGLKNGETAGDVFTDDASLPVLACDATKDSPEGEYEITVAGPKNTKNYSVKYVSGKLSVKGTTAIDGNIHNGIYVHTEGNVVLVENSGSRLVSLFGTDGILIGSSKSKLAKFPVAKEGIYILKVEGKAYKIFCN